MTRIAFLLALAACGGSSKPAETAPPPPPPTTASETASHPKIVPAECEGGGVRATYDGKSATVTKNDVSLGTGPCMITAMAVYSVLCRNSTFQFLYAGVPGTPAIGGKSAQLDVNGTTMMMDCHLPGATAPAANVPPAIDAELGDRGCHCAADERCVPSPVSAHSHVCVRNDRPPPVQ